MSGWVRCETCHVLLPRDSAHDAIDMDNEERWWCEDCCPLCMIFDEPEAGLSITKMFEREPRQYRQADDERPYPEWMERDPETGEVP